ncbi:12976_t:CDS:2 [Ambispora gerdemannii]|uniref:12976_t:CDS:1 n=1 Tax=Ambispora gerdemannii TaxID=144530 RepID=A0A9N8ZWQ0_9GLOM|nr:12976_t:CDS:2 [Ambispora gerdemannii]
MKKNTPVKYRYLKTGESNVEPEEQKDDEEVRILDQVREIFIEGNNRLEYDDFIELQIQAWISDKDTTPQNIFSLAEKRQDQRKYWTLLAFFNVCGFGTPCNNDNAFQWYKKAAEIGDSLGQQEVGFMYQQGIGTDQNLKEEIKWFSKASDAGMAIASYHLAGKYLRGERVKMDKSRAIDLYKKSAEAGFIQAYAAIGEILLDQVREIFIEGNNRFEYDDFIELQIKAWLSDKDTTPQKIFSLAEKRQDQSKYWTLLAFFNLRGFGTPRNNDNAFQWYKKAAEIGDSLGQQEVGYLYQQGIGTDQNLKEAIKWFSKAADAGMMIASRQLAGKYLRGERVKMDKSRAMDLYEKSAKVATLVSSSSQRTISTLSPQRKECIVCTESFDMTQLIRISIDCQHENNICQECVAGHIEHELQDKGNTEIRCLDENCRNVMTEDYVKKLASETIFERYQQLSLVSTLSQIEDFYWCLNPNCHSGQIHYEGVAAPIMTCQSCSKKTCVMHLLPIPDGSLNCPQCINISEQQELKRQEDLQKERNRKMEEKSKAYIDSMTKKCPKCNANIEKNDGCDHMTCRAPRCGYEFCWLCFADYDAIRKNGNAHHMQNCKYYA